MTDRNDAPPAGFRDEPRDPELQARFRARLDASLQSTWPAGRRLRYGLIAGSGMVGFLVAGSLSLTEPSTTPPAVRGLLGLFALFGLGWSAFGVWAMVRKSGDFARERRVASQLAMGFTLAALIGLGLAETILGKGSASAPMLVVALGFVVLAAVGSVHARIEEAELSILEHLLRLELRSTPSRPAPDETR